MAPRPKAVVITGASTGIGEACARAVAARGHHVFAGVRKESDGERVRAAHPELITPVMLDVTDPVQIAKAAETVSDALGDAPLGGLVNNAGIVVVCPLEFIPLDELRRQMEVNLIGVVAVTQAFLPLLRKGPGRIVHIGSVNGKAAMPFLGPYCASKHALEAVTDTMRMELAQWNLHVSLVDPGPIKTPLWEKSQSAAAALLEDLDPKAEDMYGPLFDGLRRATAKSENRAIPPERVADQVIHALTAVKPKTRYYSGLEANILVRIRKFLPDRMFDRLVLKQLRSNK